MKQIHVSNNVFQTFSESFRLHVHKLIAWGYATARLPAGTENEEEITDILYQEIQNLLRSGRERWFSNYAVKNEDPISGVRRKGKSRREIDLIIEFVTSRGRPQYIFEAKALNYRKTYQRTANYMNRNGIGRFIEEGEYASYTAHYPEVGMLGYVLSDTPEVWRDRLKEAISKAKGLRLRAQPRDVYLLDAFHTEWLSEHDRTSANHPIAIYHILLDCCS